MRTLTLLFAFALIPFCLQAQISGGPDGFGYTWLSTLSPAPNAPSYNWIDITSTGTLVTGLGDDNSVGPIPMGISFHYYWTSYTGIYIGSNGYIGFQPVNISSTGIGFPTLPTAGDGNDNYVAPFMADLTFASAGNPAQCYIWSNGVDSCIVSYINVPFWINNTAQFGGSNTFQTIFSAVDSSITFQYQSQSGSWDAAYATAMNPAVRGIENVTGAIGLMVSNNTLPTPGFAIKFFYPDVITLSVPDISPTWALNPGNGAVFVPVNGDPITGTANIQNVGNTNITTGTGVQLQIRNAANNTLLHSDANTVSSLPVGTGATVSFNAGYTPTSPLTMIYRVSTTNSVDINISNNQRDVEIISIDTTTNNMTLSYWGGTPGNAANNINWSGGNIDDGLGMYIEPPFYPIEITSVDCYVFVTGLGIVGPTAFGVRIYDDSAGPGLGTQLAQGSVSAGAVVTDAWNSVSLNTPVVINSGGFYVGWYMIGENIALGTELNPPFSNRNYEVLASLWSPFRFGGTQELMMRVNMQKACVPFAVNIGPDQTICDGQSITLNAGSGLGGYAWSTGATTQTITVNTAGTYAVSVMDANGCPGADTMTLSILPSPTVSLGADAVVCDGTTVTVDAGPGFSTYSWSTGATTQSQQFTTSGCYSVTITDGNGCAASDTVCITVNPTPSVNLGPDFAICQGGAQVLSAGGGFASYVWSTGDITSTLQVVEAGQFWVVVTDANGCSGTDTVNVTVNEPQVDLGTDINFCAGGSAMLNAGSGFAAYIWSNGATTPSITVSTAGAFSVTVVDATGCTGGDTVNVQIDPIPVSAFTYSTTNGLSFNFMSAASDATGWIWDFGDGGSSTLENPVYTYAVGGTYAVTLIVTNACGSDTLSQILTSTAIDPAGLAAAVKVFPVPADERLFVGMLGLEQESFQCSLTDVQGRTIRTAVFKAGASERMLDWNVGDLSPGVYLLRIEGGGTQLSRKVLLAR